MKCRNVKWAYCKLGARQLSDDVLPQILMDTAALIRLILIDWYKGCSKTPKNVLAWRLFQLIGSRAKGEKHHETDNFKRAFWDELIWTINEFRYHVINQGFEITHNSI